jgi:hypothetical protein
MTEEKKDKVLKKITGNMLNRVKAFDESIARQEARALEDVLPDGHPLKAEVEKQKALLGGDLSGLPPGHPLLVRLQMAKEAYERGEVQKESQKMQENAIELRKAKRIEEAKVGKERREKETAFAKEYGEAARNVNKGLEEVQISVRKLWEIFRENEENLNKNPLNRARVLRLKRLLFAVERGLSESHFSKVV